MKRIILVALPVAVVLLITLASQLSVGATTPTSAKSLAKDLLPSSYAKKDGFTDVAEKVTTSSDTGAKSCPNGAQAVFEDASGQMGLATEVLGCTTSKAAAALLRSMVAGTSASSSPPSRLGSSAVERSIGDSTYAIVWRRGKLLEMVQLNTDVPASSSSSTSTTTAAPPITRAQEKVLSSAAVEQDTRLS